MMKLIFSESILFRLSLELFFIIFGWFFEILCKFEVEVYFLGADTFYSGPRGRRNEPRCFPKQPLFCWYLLIGVSYGSNFFFERKNMMLENVLDTQNMVVGRQENFLRRLEVGFHSLLKTTRYRLFDVLNLFIIKKVCDHTLQVAVENFPDVLRPCSEYIKHSLASYLYARKKN